MTPSLTYRPGACYDEHQLYLGKESIRQSPEILLYHGYLILTRRLSLYAHEYRVRISQEVNELGKHLFLLSIDWHATAPNRETNQHVHVFDTLENNYRYLGYAQLSPAWSNGLLATIRDMPGKTSDHLLGQGLPEINEAFVKRMIDVSSRWEAIRDLAIGGIGIPAEKVDAIGKLDHAADLQTLWHAVPQTQGSRSLDMPIHTQNKIYQGMHILLDECRGGPPLFGHDGKSVFYNDCDDDQWHKYADNFYEFAFQLLIMEISLREHGRFIRLDNDSPLITDNFKALPIQSWPCESMPGDFVWAQGIIGVNIGGSYAATCTRTLMSEYLARSDSAVDEPH